MKKTSVGIIGCGNISKAYVQGARTFEVLSVDACADVDMARAEALAVEFGIPKVRSVEDLLADEDIEIVINLTVPAAHAEVALKGLKRGKHVYSEKPFATRRREAREVIGLARDKGLRVGAAPDTFLGAGLQTCRKVLDEGAIGTPIGGVAFMAGRGHETWHPNPEFYYKKGGGPLFDMGPYYITALTTLLGPVRRVSGSARISLAERTISSQPLAGQQIKVEVDTHVAGVLDFESGPIVSLIMSFDVAGHNLPRLEIYGSEGTLSLPDPNTFGGDVRVFTRSSREWKDVPLAFPHAQNLRGLGVADMASALAHRREHRANERVAYHVLDVMHSLIDSSESSRHEEIKSTMSRPAPLPEGLAASQVGP
jgi:predicted dehydrogenase